MKKIPMRIQRLTPYKSWTVLYKRWLKGKFDNLTTKKACGNDEQKKHGAEQ